jgi:hypothetical protein
MNRRGEEKITKMAGALVAGSSGFVFACVAMGREIESVQGIPMVVVFKEKRKEIFFEQTVSNDA